MKIYTKTGDEGTTFDGKGRVPKYDCSMDGQGELDELNAWIGMIRQSLHGERRVSTEVQGSLQKIQETLFNIGGQLATRKQLLRPEDVTFLESKIDQMNDSLPELKNFVYPTETPTIHVARAVCRRTERVVAAWRNRSLEKFPEPNAGLPEIDKFNFVIPYLNRLSDYLFVLARFWSETDDIWVTDRNEH